MTRRERLAPVLLLALAAGCDRAEGRTFEVVERNGVPVAINYGAAQDVWRVTQPATRIGDVDGPITFGNVTKVAALADGGFLVADGQGGVARFTIDGRHILDIGGCGEGPGELNSPFAIVTEHDSVWILSLVPPRLSLFNLNGEFIRVVQLEKPSRGLPLHRFRGRFVDEVEWGQLIDPRPAEAAIVRVAEGQAADTLIGPYPVPEFGWRIEDPVSRVGMMVQPPVFSMRPPWVACGEHLVWGNPTSGELEVHDTTGSLVRRVVLPRYRQQVATADKEAYIRAGVDLWGGQVANLDSMVRSTPFAEYRPLITGMICGDDGEVWVADFAPGVARPFDAIGNEWDIVASDGRLRTRVRFPPGFRLTDVRGRHAYGVGIGELGISVVEVFSLAN